MDNLDLSDSDTVYLFVFLNYVYFLHLKYFSYYARSIILRF
jgi:hypothetical protein